MSRSLHSFRLLAARRPLAEPQRWLRRRCFSRRPMFRLHSLRLEYRQCAVLTDANRLVAANPRAALYNLIIAPHLHVRIVHLPSQARGDLGAAARAGSPIGVRGRANLDAATPGVDTLDAAAPPPHRNSGSDSGPPWPGPGRDHLRPALGTTAPMACWPRDPVLGCPAEPALRRAFSAGEWLMAIPLRNPSRLLPTAVPRTAIAAPPAGQWPSGGHAAIDMPFSHRPRTSDTRPPPIGTNAISVAMPADLHHAPRGPMGHTGGDALDPTPRQPRATQQVHGKFVHPQPSRDALRLTRRNEWRPAQLTLAPVPRVHAGMTAGAGGREFGPDQEHSRRESLELWPVETVYGAPRAPAPQPANPPQRPVEPAKPRIDVEQVTRDVMRQLQKRLRIERERRGML